MKLLITTQIVDLNDPVLGFFHRWLSEFAVNCEQVVVICLKKGKYSLPDNVKILSLGKENSASKLKYAFNFYKYIWQERKNYDAVFVHMNPEYVVLGGVFWQLWHKKIALWYTHKSVNLKLRLAEKLVDIIFTASQKSFRLPTNKIKIMGHGIDLEIFKPTQTKLKTKIIMQVGRISEVKGQLTLVKAFKKIVDKIPEAMLYIVGSAINERDKIYQDEVIKYIKEHKLADSVKLLGPIVNDKIPSILEKVRVSVNLSSTGSLDKDILEAMACNVHPISINEAFRNILPKNNFIYNIDELPDKIIFFLNNSVECEYREIIKNSHNLKELIKNIVIECVE